MEKSYYPQTEAEMSLVRAISDDTFRLQRAAGFESAIFAEAADKFAADPEQSTGDPLLDSCISNGQTWLAEARNLNLLSLYENRTHRRIERNMAELRRLQAERRAQLEVAVAEAALLAQAAEITGEKADTAEPFARRNFEFSAFETARMIDRYRRLEEAKRVVSASKKTQRRAA